MQIIIARSTVNTLADQTQEITNTVIMAMGEKPLTVKMAEASVEVTNLKNLSVNQTGDRVIVDINDEIFFKYMSLYIKLVTMIMPFIGMLKMVGNMMKAETRSLVEFIAEEKEEASPEEPSKPEKLPVQGQRVTQTLKTQVGPNCYSTTIIEWFVSKVEVDTEQGHIVTFNHFVQTDKENKAVTPVTVEEKQWFMDGEFKNPTFKLV
jgi:hypothetical protein